MDRFWSLTPRAPEYKRVTEVKDGNTRNSIDALEHDEELRADIHRPCQKYSFIAMVAYLFYIPLYIAGPITSFNSFSSCIERKQQSHSLPQLMRMLARVLLMGIVLEVSVHFFYYTAISESGLRHNHPPAFPINTSQFALIFFLSSALLQAPPLNATYLLECAQWKFFGVATSCCTTCF
jgi:hypothetical protein